MAKENMRISQLRVERFLAQEPLMQPCIGYAVQVLTGVDPAAEMFLKFDNAHVHPSFCELYYIRSGKLAYQVEGELWHAHAGDVIYLPPGISHTLSADSLPIERVWVGMERFLLDLASALVSDLNFVAFPDLDRPLLLHTSGQAGADLASAFTKLGDACKGEQPGWEMKSRCAALELIVELAQANYEQNASQEEKRQCLLERIQRYVEQHLAQPLDRASVCRQFYISPSTLSHLFQSYVGVSFSQYVTARRMERAAVLLSNDGVRPPDVCEFCGYGEYSSFFRAFKKYYGCGPQEWLTRAREMD